MADNDCEKDEHGRFVHELCDVFTISPELVAKRAEDGRDPNIVAVRIYKFASSGRAKVRIAGEYLPENVTTTTVLKQWGPGRYEFMGVNHNGQFVTNSTMSLGSVDASEVSEALPGLNAVAPPAPAPEETPAGPVGVDPMFAYMMQQSAQAQAQSQQMMMGVLQVMGQALVGQQQPANDGMSKLAEAIAANSAATVAGMSAQAQSPQAQATADQTDFMKSIVMKAMEGKSNEGAVDTTQILLAMLADKDQDGKFWESIFPTLVENLGIPVMGAIATALPEDKAKMLLALLEEQAKVKVAEANADAAEASAGGSVDTEGVAAE